MTESQWWYQVGRFVQSGEWNGLLVAADGFQELGQDDVADGLRWLVRSGIRPHEKDWIWTASMTFAGRRISQRFSSVRYMLQWLIKVRQDALKQLT